MNHGSTLLVGNGSGRMGFGGSKLSFGSWVVPTACGGVKLNRRSTCRGFGA